jgi:subtilisin family serine protease
MRNSLRGLQCLMLLVLVGLPCAQAQVLPQVQVPLPQVPLPRAELPLPVDPTLERVGDTVRGLTRTARADALRRQHRAELDRDPRGELVIRAEVVGVDITPSALEAALAADFRVLRRRELADLGIRITVLQTPAGMSARRGLGRLRKLDPAGIYDYNHVYLESGAPGEHATPVPPAETTSGLGKRVGLIDGGVDSSHQALHGLRIERFGCEGATVPSLHGTSVASLLAASTPGATLFAADVYCGVPTGGASDAVATALGWMARERVAVINVSLVGPRNALLERAVGALVARGFLVVAAVGNDGPAAPPLYPAAHEGVIGVTGVDARHRVLVEAGRGKHVDFAAPGADMNAATLPPDRFAPVRGTSFAAPIVAGLLAAALDAPDPARRDAAIAALAARAVDLGARGRDEVYGAGEVGSAPQAAKIQPANQ